MVKLATFFVAIHKERSVDQDRDNSNTVDPHIALRIAPQENECHCHSSKAKELTSVEIDALHCCIYLLSFIYF
jgi:hypothetical protein